MLSIYPSSIQNSALPKISLTTGSPKKRIFQEDLHIGFIANDTISASNYVTK